MPPSTETLKIGRRTVALSNPEKVMYPRTGFTKRDVVAYYLAVAPWLLPHLRGRALTMKRYPDGVEGISFYEKKCPAHRPDWVRTASVARKTRGDSVDRCVAADLPTLVWAANLADLELHVPLALAQSPDRPTALVFDLDPGPPAGLHACAQVALRLHAVFAALRLTVLAKVSGSKGLQLYVPLNRAVTFEETGHFARTLAERLADEAPALVTANMRRAERPGKVLIDWSQNAVHKTTVCVYSLRATPEPRVSAPLTWEEIERAAAKAKEAERLRFSPEASLERCQRLGDLFAPLRTLKQTLPAI